MATTLLSKHVRGSIPSFRPRECLVRDDGSIFGTIRGGEVREAEVWPGCARVIRRLLTFGLNQGPSVRHTGLVCGGTLDIL